MLCLCLLPNTQGSKHYVCSLASLHLFSSLFYGLRGPGGAAPFIVLPTRSSSQLHQSLGLEGSGAGLQMLGMASVHGLASSAAGPSTSEEISLGVLLGPQLGVAVEQLDVSALR